MDPVPVQACCKMCSQGRACEDGASPGIAFARRGRVRMRWLGHRPGSASNQLIGRLGLSADYEDQWVNAIAQVSRVHVYGIANLHYDFLDGSHVDVW